MSALPQATATTRWGGILIGLGTHALFTLTVWRLFLFLQSPADGYWAGNQATNLLLSLVIRLTGFGWQTGWTPWLAWFRGEPPPRRGFNPTGAFRYFRHPVYLSFLGLLWFSPVMTLDRAILVGTWTVYIFVGSLLKDQRLHFYLGDRYRDYQQQVPGYPLLGFGPWGRLAKAPEMPAEIEEAVPALPVSEVRRRAA